MKTEREQLEENTRIEYAKQRTQEFRDFLATLMKEWELAFYWEARGTALFLFAMAVNLILIIASGFFVEFEVIRTPLDFLSTIVWLTLLRVYWLMAERKYAEGRLDGCFATLEQLGMLDKDDDFGGKKRRVKEKSAFKRFKELFQRVGQNQIKEVPA